MTSETNSHACKCRLEGAPLHEACRKQRGVPRGLLLIAHHLGGKSSPLAQWHGLEPGTDTPKPLRGAPGPHGGRGRGTGTPSPTKNALTNREHWILHPEFTFSLLKARHTLLDSVGKGTQLRPASGPSTRPGPLHSEVWPSQN